MFKKAGEVYVGGHFNAKGNISANLGAAVSDHIAVIANGSSVNTGANSNDYFRQWLAEGGIGYFTTIGKEKRQVLEMYAGYGVGSSKDHEQRASVYGYELVEAREMNFDKIFLQVNYSSTRKKKINIFGDKKELNYGTAIRLSRVGMKEFWLNEMVSPTEENYFIEPLFFTRMELLNGLQIQYTNGFNIGLNSNEYLKAGNSVFTLGLVYTFGK
ncbi:hypothetical protein [Sphingobacterium bovistauri]|nr:hypothetical protein [Sphingobacterium bovistauri]